MMIYYNENKKLIKEQHNIIILNKIKKNKIR